LIIAGFHVLRVNHTPSLGGNPVLQQEVLFLKSTTAWNWLFLKMPAFCNSGFHYENLVAPLGLVWTSHIVKMQGIEHLIRLLSSSALPLVLLYGQ